MPAKNYFRNLLIAIDQLGNTLAGGKADETISSRLGRAMVRVNADHRGEDRLAEALARPLCWALDRLDRKHCAASIELDADGNPKAKHL